MQRAQLVGLAFGQLGVERFEPLAVLVLQPRPQQLARVGQQPVLGGERLGLDEEVARDLVGVELGLLGDLLQRFAQRGLERLAGAEPLLRVRRRHDHREQVGPGAVAVDVDLPHQRAADEHRLQPGHGHELALGQLEHVLAPVHVHQPVRPDLGHDVAGAVVAVGVEDLGGDLRPLVVAGEDVLGLDQQLAPRVRAVGTEVAQLRDVLQLVVQHRRLEHVGVHDDPAGLGGAVAVVQRQVHHGLDERGHLRGDRRGADHGLHDPAAEGVVPQVLLDRGVQCGLVGELTGPPVQFALVALEQHVADPRHQEQLGGPHQLDVVEQGGQVALGGEVRGAAAGQRGQQRGAPGEVAHRHVADAQRGLVVPGHEPGPQPAHQPLRVHRALRGAGAAG